MNIRNFIQICIVENIKVLDLLLLFFDQLFDYLHRNKDKNCAAERFKDLNVFRTYIMEHDDSFQRRNTYNSLSLIPDIQRGVTP